MINQVATQVKKETRDRITAQVIDAY